MGINEREHHIKVLEKLLKETNGKIELYSENKNIDLTKEKEIAETLGYTISSLKTDLKYDLMYEREEIFTKADMVAMLTDLQLEIEELKPPLCHNASRAKGCADKWRVEGLIQEKINALRGSDNE